MKKMFLFLMLFVATVATVNAQSGDVFVLNDTECDIAIDVAASCPDDCNTYYGSNMMTIVHPQGFPGYHLYNESLPWPNPYFNPTDPTVTCFGQWTWSYADVVIFCNGTAYTTRVGNPFTPCGNIYPRYVKLDLPGECLEECYGGQDIWVKWSQNPSYPGDIIITIGH